MGRFVFLWVVLSSFGSVAAPVQVEVHQREDLMSRAQVWNAQNKHVVFSKYIVNHLLECTFVTAKGLGGTTRKFLCADGNNKQKKVKYQKEGDFNGEIFGAPLASRLFMKLGFYSDASYFIRTLCQNCPGKDPYKSTDSKLQDVLFAGSSIKDSLEGYEIVLKDLLGWSYSELAKVQEEKGGATLAQTEALKLLTAIVNNWDSKSEQQSLICLNAKEGGACDDPVLFVKDLGATFGVYTGHFNKHKSNFEKWSKLPVWSDEGKCVAHAHAHRDGTLKNPHILEVGRKFLAEQFAELTDEDLEYIFGSVNYAIMDQEIKEGKIKRPVNASDWIRAMKLKMNQVINHTCPL